MSSVYTPTAVVPPTSYTIPSDGDPKTAASVNVPFQSIMDGVRYLNEGKRPSAVHSKWTHVHWQSADANWDFGFGTQWGPKQLITATQIGGELDLPDGCTLTSVTVYIDPANGGGHGGGLPTLPGYSVFKLDPTSGIHTQIGTAKTDTSGSVPVYEALHFITPALTGLSEVINKEVNRYYIIFTGEGGGNFQAGLRIVGVQVGFTTTKQDDSAA